MWISTSPSGKKICNGELEMWQMAKQKIVFAIFSVIFVAVQDVLFVFTFEYLTQCRHIRLPHWWCAWLQLMHLTDLSCVLFFFSFNWWAAIMVVIVGALSMWYCRSFLLYPWYFAVLKFICWSSSIRYCASIMSACVKEDFFLVLFLQRQLWLCDFLLLLWCLWCHR